MKTITINLYEFDELSDEAKENAIQEHRECGFEYDWWDSIYDDARQNGLKITGFDLYRRDITGELTMPMLQSMNEIMGNHGELCGTYKMASMFLKQYFLLENDLDVINRVDNEEMDVIDAIKEVAEEGLEGIYKQALLHEYYMILKTEYEDRTSDEGITESIHCNDYWFTEDGRYWPTRGR